MPCPLCPSVILRGSRKETRIEHSRTMRRTDGCVWRARSVSLGSIAGPTRPNPPLEPLRRRDTLPRRSPSPAAPASAPLWHKGLQAAVLQAALAAGAAAAAAH